MKLLIRNLRLSPSEEEALLYTKVTEKLGISKNQMYNLKIVRRSLDARKKEDIHFLYSVTVELEYSKLLLSKKNADVSEVVEKGADELHTGSILLSERPVVVGSGPCGMFAALTLARFGFKPIVIERGAPVEERVDHVNMFWSEGKLDENSNVLFGEGGAGTFSDGKLTTRIKDPRGQNVLLDLSAFGANPSIVYDAKPHIGTDVLRKVVARLRKEVLSLGGEYRFHTKFLGFEFESHKIKAVKTDKGTIPTSICILATGHSARDVYEYLNGINALLVPKPFAVGVRIEHHKDMIDQAQFGKMAGDPRLGAAEYTLSTRNGSRGVYTFCMCPGGVVVASSNETNGVVTNGMSYSTRDCQNSNSAVVVQVGPEDYGNSALSGMEFQRRIETAAYKLGGGNYVAPAQRVGDFLKNQRTVGFGGIIPTYKPGVIGTSLNKCLPDFVHQSIFAALPKFGKMLKGFDMGDAVMTAVESRTSAPVRIQRDEECTICGPGGIYPAGEGAGYAGGIVSAAVDGMKVAGEIVKKFNPHNL